MIKFTHDGVKYRLRFLYNKSERGTQKVRYREPAKNGDEYGYYPYRGVTMVQVWKGGDGGCILPYGRGLIEVFCSETDVFYERTGAELALREWLFFYTGERTSSLHDAAWKAFREQFYSAEGVYIDLSAPGSLKTILKMWGRL